jgi:hypothetical protein
MGTYCISTNFTWATFCVNVEFGPTFLRFSLSPSWEVDLMLGVFVRYRNQSHVIIGCHSVNLNWCVAPSARYKKTPFFVCKVAVFFSSYIYKRELMFSQDGSRGNNGQIRFEAEDSSVYQHGVWTRHSSNQLQILQCERVDRGERERFSRTVDIISTLTQLIAREGFTGYCSCNSR